MERLKRVHGTRDVIGRHSLGFESLPVILEPLLLSTEVVDCLFVFSFGTNHVSSPILMIPRAL